MRPDDKKDIVTAIWMAAIFFTGLCLIFQNP